MVYKEGKPAQAPQPEYIAEMTEIFWKLREFLEGWSTTDSACNMKALVLPWHTLYTSTSTLFVGQTLRGTYTPCVL